MDGWMDGWMDRFVHNIHLIYANSLYINAGSHYFLITIIMMGNSTTKLQDFMIMIIFVQHVLYCQK